MIADHTEIIRATSSPSATTIAYISVFSTMLIMSFVILCIKVSALGQKTRNTQPRRTYLGTHQRPSDTQTEPTIYVSPANLPPPPKYEAMAPPSYEEVVGIHYPNFQPISQPITTALAQSSNSTDVPVTNVGNHNANNGIVINSNTQAPSTVISVTSERSPVTASS